MSLAWSNPKFQGRYIYVIEREWESITLNELNKQEVRFTIRRNTFNDSNENGLNFVLGNGSGVRSETTKERMRIANILSHDNPTTRDRCREIARKQWSDPKIKARTVQGSIRYGQSAECKAVRKEVHNRPEVKMNWKQKVLMNPTHQANRLKALRSPEVQAKCLATLKKYHELRASQRKLDGNVGVPVVAYLV